jgi:membrane protein DedA with SNARE-associated domain
MFKSYGLVFLLGIAGIWKAIPVGFVLKLDPELIIFLTVLGASVGIVVIFLLGSRVKRYITGRMKKKKSLKSKSDKIQRILDKYGPVGLGLLGSLIFGPNATMAIGLIMVNSEKKLLVWTFAGTVLWTSVITIIASTGIDIISGI